MENVIFFLIFNSARNNSQTIDNISYGWLQQFLLASH